MTNREQDRERIARLRGWIIYLLYSARLRTLELGSLRRLLDRRNMPVSRRRLAEEIEYLRALRLLKISGSAHKELDEMAQARLVQRYADSDREDVEIVSAVLTAAGINFQEELEDNQIGIARVE